MPAAEVDHLAERAVGARRRAKARDAGRDQRPRACEILRTVVGRGVVGPAVAIDGSRVPAGARRHERRRETLEQDVALREPQRQAAPNPGGVEMPVGRRRRVPFHDREITPAEQPRVDLVEHRVLGAADRHRRRREVLDEHPRRPNAVVEQPRQPEELLDRAGTVTAEVEHDGRRAIAVARREHVRTDAEGDPRRADEDDERHAGARGDTSFEPMQAIDVRGVAEVEPQGLDRHDGGRLGERQRRPASTAAPAGCDARPRSHVAASCVPARRARTPPGRRRGGRHRTQNWK